MLLTPSIMNVQCCLWKTTSQVLKQHFYSFSGMDIGIGLGEEPGPSGGRDQKSEEEYHHEVLSTEQIVQHMVESIKEVNSVIQVSLKFLF